MHLTLNEHDDDDDDRLLQREWLPNYMISRKKISNISQTFPSTKVF